MKNLHKIMQGWYKGCQDWRDKLSILEAKGFATNNRLKKKLDKLEKKIISYGTKAKRDPSFRLTKREAEDLNYDLGRSGDVMSDAFRKSIEDHCRGKCDLGNIKKFEFVAEPPPAGTPIFHITGWVMTTDINTTEGDDIDEKVEKLTEVLEMHKNAMSSAYPEKVATYSFERGIIKMKAQLPPDADVEEQWMIDESGETSELKLLINGKEITRPLAQKAIAFFKKNHGWMTR